MALPSTNLSITEIQNVLGDTANGAALCLSQKINPFSAAKPYNPSFASTFGLSWGTSLGDFMQLKYNRPQDNYSFGQFRSYNHTQEPPVLFELLDVKTMADVSVWNNGSPIVVKGVAPAQYKWTFRFKRGTNAINPSTINAQTKWDKSTSLDYGGIYISENGSADLSTPIVGSKIYSVTDNWQTITDYVAYADNSIYVFNGTSFEQGKAPIEVWYARQAGINDYRITSYRIETQSPIINSPYKTWWHNMELLFDNSFLTNLQLIDNEGSYIMQYDYHYELSTTTEIRFFKHVLNMSDSSTPNPVSFRYRKNSGSWSDIYTTFTNNNEMHLPVGEELIANEGDLIQVQVVYYFNAANFNEVQVFIWDSIGYVNISAYLMENPS